jgi:23S rRNA (adenine2503-C2)-methyltransferase
VALDIKSLTQEELQAQFQSWDQPTYRVAQVLHWLYARRAADWDTMTNVPKALRTRLSREFTLHTLAPLKVQGARDATRKFLWRLADHALIESVLIPANPALFGDASDRHTLCVSTQVGCAYGCKFCASGLGGWKRNLAVEEIVEQVLAVERWCAGEQAEAVPRLEASKSKPPARTDVDLFGVADESAKPPAAVTPDAPPATTSTALPTRFVDNLVIMGMGEPLANYENLLKALGILNAPWGCGIGARKVTISTSGLAPQIRRLADEPHQFRLAISLHGATDEVRGRIMPVNRKHPLRELVAACEYYLARKGRMLTFEYILIAGVNDALEHARPLAQLADQLHAKVNLIPYNRVEGLPWERPSEAVQEAFLGALEKLKVAVTLRREKGHDIDAACGQLRLKTEKELALPQNPGS